MKIKIISIKFTTLTIQAIKMRTPKKIWSKLELMSILLTKNI